MGPGSASSRAPGGTVGDRYDLLDQLGAGGMGTVWRAHDRVLDRFVAVKLFDHAAAGADPADQSRATREARVLAQLNHPNLVAVLDAGGKSSERLDHLVMELVGGPTLRDRVRRGPLPLDAVQRLGAELGAGLAYVHDRGVVHRDLKPANILFDSGEESASAKIADFGIARLLSSAPLTSTGLLVGTATYLSPEQATGARVGTESDVYSLSLVLLECLTGRAAYEGQGIEAVSARLHRDPDLTAVREPRTRTLLAAMTAREPGRRPDARTVADAFDVLAAGDTGRFDRLGFDAPGRVPAAGAASTRPIEPPTRVEHAGTEELAVTRVRPSLAPSGSAPAGRAPVALGPTGAAGGGRSRRRRITPIAVATALLLTVALALGAGLLGSSDRAPSPDSPDPSGPSAVVTGTGPTASSAPTSRSSGTTRPSSSAPSTTASRPSASAPRPSRSTPDGPGNGPSRDTGPGAPPTAGDGPGDDPPKGRTTGPQEPAQKSGDDQAKGPAARP